jgi:hypothetical protein
MHDTIYTIYKATVERFVKDGERVIRYVYTELPITGPDRDLAPVAHQYNEQAMANREETRYFVLHPGQLKEKGA